MILFTTGFITQKAIAKETNLDRLYREFHVAPLDQSGDALIVQKRFEKWMKRAKKQTLYFQYSNNHKIKELRNKISKIDMRKGPYAVARKVNQIINQSVAFHYDYDLYKKEDYWASPEETISKGGDCEDIALLKVMALYMLGIEPEKLNLMMGYVNDMGKVIKHAVLALEIDNDIVILNNLNNRLQNHNKNLFFPLYSIDTNGIVAFKPKSTEM